MPALVLYAMGKSPQLAPVNKTEIVIGREPGCDIVLASDTVSRRHALIQRDSNGAWHIVCVSATNPIVVNGALLTSSALLSEGDEVLIGTEHLMVFSENEVKASEYMRRDSYFARSECAKCGWVGMISVLRRTPVCPKCGSKEVVALNIYRKDSQVAPEGLTRAVSGAEVRASLQKLREAKRSRIERLDGLQDRHVSKELSESEPCTFAKGERATFRLYGITIGSGVTIRWSGQHFVVETSLFYPSLKVNGRKVKLSVLKSGDVIEIGRNRFRFITE